MDTGLISEVIVVDDASDISVADVLHDNGFNKIVCYRNQHNLGIARTFNVCISQAHGDLLHILHADDYVLPGFYEAVIKMASTAPDRGLYFTRGIVVDEFDTALGETFSQVGDLAVGEPDVNTCFLSNRFAASGVVVRQSAYHHLGGFLHDLRHFADWEMWNRVIMSDGCCGDLRSLFAYRMTSETDSASILSQGLEFREYEILYNLWASRYSHFPRLQFRKMTASRECDFVCRSLPFRGRGKDFQVRFIRWWKFSTLLQKLFHPIRLYKSFIRYYFV